MRWCREARGIYLGGEVHAWSSWGLLNKIDHLENVRPEGRIILKTMQNIG